MTRSRFLLRYRLLLPDRAMPEDQYVVHVSVDGVPIPDDNICNGNYKPYHCSLYVRHWFPLRFWVPPSVPGSPSSFPSGSGFPFWFQVLPPVPGSPSGSLHLFCLPVLVLICPSLLQTRWWRTPTIYSLNPVTGLPGTTRTCCWDRPGPVQPSSFSNGM